MIKRLLSFILLFLLVFSVPAYAPIDLDGADDLVIVSAPSFLADTSGTISLLVKMGDLGSFGILCSSSKTGSTDGELRLDFRGDLSNQLDIVLNLSGGLSLQLRSPTNVINDITTFHLVTITSDGNGGTLRLFVDGVEKALSEETGNNTGQWFDNAANADTFAMGGIKRVAATAPVNAVINEFHIYDTDLSLAEISIIYNSGMKRTRLQNLVPNIVSYWSIDDGPDGTSADGDTVKDLSRNNNEGTGDDGANNTGLTWTAEEVLTYQ
jgi:hypothetical protein